MKSIILNQKQLLVGEEKSREFNFPNTSQHTAPSSLSEPKQYPNLHDKETFNCEEAAHIVGLAPHTLYKWNSKFKRGKLPTGHKYLLPRQGGSRVLYTRRAIEEFLGYR